jgi:hypothetical protein
VTPEEFVETWVRLLKEAKEQYPEWRTGQAMFNTLYQLEPEVADMVRGRLGIDPFYNDNNIPAFLYEVFGGNHKDELEELL